MLCQWCILCASLDAMWRWVMEVRISFSEWVMTTKWWAMLSCSQNHTYTLSCWGSLGILATQVTTDPGGIREEGQGNSAAFKVTQKKKMVTSDKIKSTAFQNKYGYNEHISHSSDYVFAPDNTQARFFSFFFFLKKALSLFPFLVVYCMYVRPYQSSLYHCVQLWHTSLLPPSANMKILYGSGGKVLDEISLFAPLCLKGAQGEHAAVHSAIRAAKGISDIKTAYLARISACRSDQAAEQAVRGEVEKVVFSTPLFNQSQPAQRK